VDLQKFDSTLRSLGTSKSELETNLNNARISGSDRIAIQKVEHLQKYLQLSKSIESSATTYYEGSISGTVIGDYQIEGSVVGLSPEQSRGIDLWRMEEQFTGKRQKSCFLAI
jgi:hypothetical protein